MEDINDILEEINKELEKERMKLYDLMRDYKILSFEQELDDVVPKNDIPERKLIKF